MIAYVQQNWTDLATVSAVGFVSAGLVVLAHRSPRMIRPAVSDLFAVQASHDVPTPRLGGVALVIALMAAIYFVNDVLQLRAGVLLACASPLLLAGVLEDLRRNVRPIWRLAAAAGASGIVVVFFGRWLPRLDIPVIDELMQFLPLAWFVTIFAVTGLSHAFNIVDGMNGLCLSVAISAATAIALLAYAVGDRDFAEILVLVVAAMAGVLAWNFPFGKVFLGDAGAYLIGFLIAWLAVGIVWRNPQVSAWTVLLTCFWPVAETTLAIVRRIRRRKLISHPDNRHTHHLVLRCLEMRWLGQNRRRLSNPLTTLVMAPFFLAPPITAVLLRDAPFASFLAVMVFGALFVATYAWLVEILRRGRAPRPSPHSRRKHGETSAAGPQVDGSLREVSPV